MQQQLGLPYDGVRHVLGLFIKSSSFTRYLLDDVLPKEVFNNRQVIEEDLDNLLEECETLMVSLKTFKQLSRFLNYGEAVSTSSQNIQKKCINENGVVPVKLVESFQIMGSMLKLTKDIKQFQLYYCELCDDSSHSTNKVKEHFASERHASALLSTSDSFLTYQCKSCGLFIMATQSLLNNIIEAEFHFTVDTTFESLKLNSVNKNINVSNVPAEFNSFSKDTEDTSESLISEDTNRNDEAAEGGTCEGRKNYENDCQMSTFYKNKWSMTDVFIDINDKMLSNEIKYCHYCRPCDQALMTAQEWYFHKQSQQHQKITRGFKNYQEKCFNCALHIFGRKPGLNAYLRYHKEINHKKTNNFDQFESKKNMSTNRKLENYKSTERNFNSSWKNSSYFKATKFETTKNNLKQEQRISEDLSNFEEDETEIILNKTYEVKPCEKHEVISPIKNYASLSLYLDVIALQKKLYIETNVNSPVGACLPCFDIIRDEFDWIAHIKKFHNVNIAFIEETCEKCKISIYGPVDVITKEIWNIKEHHELDKLIN